MKYHNNKNNNDNNHANQTRRVSARLQARNSSVTKLTQSSARSIRLKRRHKKKSTQLTQQRLAVAQPMPNQQEQEYRELNYSQNEQKQRLKDQLKEATTKFDKACKQLVILDQHMSDLQLCYLNSVDNDRKTFKIVYRMQLATLEGTHNAYIEYIERQVEKIKKIKTSCQNFELCNA